jgi:hypothetical protein
MNSRITIVVAIAAIWVVSCQKAETPSASNAPQKSSTAGVPVKAGKANTVAIEPPTFVENVKLGSAVASDGSVTTEAAKFIQGQPIYFWMTFKESPRGLAATAKWYRGGETKELTEERKDMNGSHSVTFDRRDTRKWKPGHYRVEGYWGGNPAGMREFDIVKKKK